MTETSAAADTATRATQLSELHRAPELLTVVNVWDVASARAVADVPGTRAIATASYAIAASFGYRDGEHIPADLMLDAVGRIAAATDLPVTADLEAGYGAPGDTVRRAIGYGVVGANIEDKLAPLHESVAAVEAVLAAGRAEGVDFQLNARTDAYLLGGDRDRGLSLADAIERGRAYLDAGAPVVFVPGRLTLDEIGALVEAYGPQRLTLTGGPGQPSLATLQELGVARVSYGPRPQWVALTALQELASEISGGGAPPEGTRMF